MLEGKYYINIEIVFSFVVGFVDNITAYKDGAPLTKGTTIFSDIIPYLIYDQEGVAGHNPK